LSVDRSDFGSATDAEYQDQLHQNETSPPPWDVRAGEDIAHVVDFLIAGRYTEDDALFSDFVTWTADILTARGVWAATLFPALALLGKYPQ
jgi:hypothetical protein